MIGGSGPVNKKLDMDRIRGTGPEGFSDFATVGLNNEQGPSQARKRFSFEKDRPVMGYDPFSRADPVHGEESIGLGTSTFLEGTIASKKDIQRHESEQDANPYGNNAVGGNAGGLARKKSLAQRIRGMSQPRRPLDGFQKDPGSPDSPPRKGTITSPTVRSAAGPQSAGGRIGASHGDSNPFFNDYDDAYEKKGASIKVKEEENGIKEKPSSPTILERRVTADGDVTASNGDGLTRTTTNGTSSGGGGFLGRMKSLKGRKPRT